ncbi:MAG: hypothetical protein P8178_01950 [Candidatus Thiodiazotropha sp.]
MKQKPKTNTGLALVAALSALLLSAVAQSAMAVSATTSAIPGGGYRVTLGNIHNGESIWDDNRALSLQIHTQPALRDGERLIVTIDGKPVASAVKGNQILLRNIDRGAHELQARRVDSRGNTLATSRKITFYDHQHHLGASSHTAR